MRLLAAVLLIFSHAAALAEGRYPFHLAEVTDENGVQLVARNLGPLPVALLLRLDGDARAEVVPSHSTLALERLSLSADLVRVRASHRVGDFHARHMPLHEYRLPFADGQSFMVSQAPGGLLTTHASPDSWYALDIAMPEGTPVLAARAGIVITAGHGAVRVLHDDGTIAGYHHLAGGLAVGEGDGVAAGALLGHSGATGHASGPHLHFVVTRLVVGGEYIEELSEPVTFYAGRPPRALRGATGSVLTSDYPAAAIP
jgi:murein DD-endopeptidase MepM/ murein hydrolase activator NlpD